MKYTTRHERKTCRRCGGHYMTGEYRDHVRSLTHRRELERKPTPIDLGSCPSCGKKVPRGMTHEHRMPGPAAGTMTTEDAVRFLDALDSIPGRSREDGEGALLTLTEAAAVLGLEQSTLRRQIGRGSLKARKVGPIWVVTVAEVDRYRAEHLGRMKGPTK
jgi:excisionase family DNA binding protein